MIKLIVSKLSLAASMVILWASQTSAMTREEATAQSTAALALTAIQRGDAEALKAFLPKRSANEAAAIVTRLAAQGHGNHDMIKDWNGEIKGIVLDKDRASVWMCKKMNELFLVELLRDGNGWVVESIDRYQRAP